MSEERFNRLESMMEQIVKMVGQNNVAINEMRQDIAKLNQGQEELRQGQENIRQDINGLNQGQEELRQSQARMEHNLTDKVRALFDAREIQNEVNSKILTQLDRIELKIQSHDVQISVLDRTKTTRRKAK